jgi:hypothetical protein
LLGILAELKYLKNNLGGKKGTLMSGDHSVLQALAQPEVGGLSGDPILSRTAEIICSMKKIQETDQKLAPAFKMVTSGSCSWV